MLTMTERDRAPTWEQQSTVNLEGNSETGDEGSEHPVCFQLSPMSEKVAVLHQVAERFVLGCVQGYDPEEAKRQQMIQGHINKITPENYERIRDQIIAVDFSNPRTLRGLVDQVIDKALGGPAFCEMCAQLCFDLSKKLPELPAIPPNEQTGFFGREKVTFRRELLNKCQIEFEAGAAATLAVARRKTAEAEVLALHSVADGRCGCSYFSGDVSEKNLESWKMIQGLIHICFGPMLVMQWSGAAFDSDSEVWLVSCPTVIVSLAG
jgi:hypothetical protein